MKLKLLNGNDNFYKTEDLTLIIKFVPNDVWLAKIKKETGLNFKKVNFNDWMECKPTSAMQIVKLLTDASTHAWVVTYTNNWNATNTIYLGIKDRERFE